MASELTRRAVLGLGTALALLMTTPANAQSPATQVTIRGGRLVDALVDLSRQTGLELLYDRAAMAGLTAPKISSRLPPEAAMERLLQGTGLVARRAADGFYVIERARVPALARQDVAVSEILVIGRRSQNADIRRLESDIQPYRVSTGEQITQADRDNLDQFFGSRIPPNTTAVRPSLDVKGETLSEIDLRGLGPTSTLVLIDGRRMPGIPAQFSGFRQADINAVPLHAIDRVETLTGAAGGIYGFGALGGVVNVVLARDRQGVELHATGGLSSRGDGAHYGLEGRIGYTTKDGRTDLMIYGSSFQADPVQAGDRNYAERDQALSTSLAPSQLRGIRPNANSVFVNNPNGGRAIRLKPAYGGGLLDAPYTFLPAGLTGDPLEVGAALLQNGGKMDTGLTAGAAESAIASTPTTGAVLANVRHRFNGGVEAYVDAVLLWNRGRYRSTQANDRATLFAGSPINPFTSNIEISYPLDIYSDDRITEVDSRRYTIGVIAPLPLGWRATGDISSGTGRYRSSEVLVVSDVDFFSVTAPNPFGDWSKFQAQLAANAQTNTIRQTIVNHFENQSLRLAGPLFETPQGPATLTLLAERRVEDVPGYSRMTSGNPPPPSYDVAWRRIRATSFYAEFRSRILGVTVPAPLRNLEVQLAARNDEELDLFVTNPRSPKTSPRRQARFSGLTYTLGAKVVPASWLMLRGSYATGETPPPVELTVENVSTNTASLRDPKRPIGFFDRQPAYTAMCCGLPDLETVRASTLSWGGVLSPWGEGGPRVTLDYSRIRKTREPFTPSEDLVLAHEDFWPERVVRAPLTDADRALGYSGGVVLMLDTRPENSAGLKIDTLDARVEWSFLWGGGRLRLYGDATHYIRQVQTAPFQSDVENVGYLGKPISWRANGGVDWSRGPWTLGGNIQYFGSYRPYFANAVVSISDSVVAIQGADAVPAQTYVDLHVAWRGQWQLAGELRDLKVDFGVVNLLDKAPPRESRFSLAQAYGTSAPYPPSYSRYGDPRQRRFVLTLSAAF